MLGHICSLTPHIKSLQEHIISTFKTFAFIYVEQGNNASLKGSQSHTYLILILHCLLLHCIFYCLLLHDIKYQIKNLITLSLKSDWNSGAAIKTLNIGESSQRDRKQLSLLEAEYNKKERKGEREM